MLFYTKAILVNVRIKRFMSTVWCNIGVFRTKVARLIIRANIVRKIITVYVGERI